MNKIDFSDWEEIYLNKLFNIENGNKFDLINMTESENRDIAFVSRTANNNGVSAYVERLYDVYPYEAGCITVALGGSIGSAFLQSQPFYTGQNVAVLSPIDSYKENMTKEIKLFFCYLIKTECKYRYVAFGRELNTHLNKDFTIRLPLKENKEVDWIRLNEFSESLILTVSPITNNNINITKLDLTSWKPYKIKDLFRLGKNKNLPRGLVTSKEDLPEGTGYFYVGAKKKNNGIMYNCGYDPSIMSKGNCIAFICNGQGSVGYTNYIDVDFYTSKDVALGYNDNLNKYNALFLVTILDKERFKYSFGRKWGRYLLETEIPLPSKEGEPDWEYMSDFVKKLPYGDCF